MHRLVAAPTLLLLLLAGCALLGSRQVQGTTPLPRDDAFSVAVETLRSMGYSIQAANRQRGYISARKPGSSVGIARAGHRLQVRLTGGDGGTEFRIAPGTQAVSRQPGEETTREAAEARVRHEAERLKRALMRVSGERSGGP